MTCFEPPRAGRPARATSAFLAIATAALLGSCGGMAPKKAQPTMAGAAPGTTSEEALPGAPADSSDPRLREILDRDTEIRSWRRDLGLATDPTVEEREEWAKLPLARAQEVCTAPEPASSRCQDMCTLADHICENADEICRIAGDLEGNAWADDKCAAAKSSCKDGKQRCCDCDDTDAPVEPDATTEPDAASTHPADLPRQ